VIGHTDHDAGGIGIHMEGYAEPRIISNDIYINDCGIQIFPLTQPSIIANDINYNNHAGIRCLSNGAGKQVVIMSNHIHSNSFNDPAGIQLAGIWVQASTPLITHNNVTRNDRNVSGLVADIDYTTSPPPICPMISLNVYDLIFRPGPIPQAGGNYNVTSGGNAILP
jgi:hypothetical protein